MNYEEFCSIWIPLGENLLPTATKLLGARQDAEDALQDLYIKLWQKRNTLDSIDRPAAYADRMLKNLCFDRLRSRKALEELPEELQGCESSDAPAENAESIRLTAAAIGKLTESERKVLEMRVMNGLSYEEIAGLTGMSKLTLRVLLSRARKKIRIKI